MTNFEGNQLLKESYPKSILESEGNLSSGHRTIHISLPPEVTETVLEKMRDGRAMAPLQNQMAQIALRAEPFVILGLSG